MDSHVKVAAWLRIIWSALGLLGALFVFVVVGGVGGLLGVSGDPEAARAMPWFVLIATAVAGLMGLMALPGLIAGWGLLTYRPWARILNIVLSILDVFNVPVGTALGAYSLWAMLHPETVALFEAGSAPTRYPTHF